MSGWFSKLGFLSTIGGMQYTLSKSMRDEELRKQIAQFVRTADFQIDDFSVQAIPLREKLVRSGAPKVVQDLILSEEKGEDPQRLAGLTLHKGITRNGDPEDIYFELEEESAGTQEFFALAGPTLDVLSNGLTLIVDELGMRLHPLLMRALIALFHNRETNVNGAQLLFTTHDTTLLDEPGPFRRDQIWITEKNETGSSSIVSLWDYKSRKGENFMRGYLAGRYGGVPFVEGLSVKDATM